MIGLAYAVPFSDGTQPTSTFIDNDRGSTTNLFLYMKSSGKFNFTCCQGLLAPLFNKEKYWVCDNKVVT
jgi:hypothetical protein